MDRPHNVEEIFSDYSCRRAGIICALTRDANKFFDQCDPEKENLCLFGNPDSSWEVALPPDEVPPLLPEPALGINFARDGMLREDWISLIAIHSDSWLLSVAFYFAVRLSQDERTRLFSMINDLPTVYEVYSDRRQLKENSSSESKSKLSKKQTSDGEPSNSKLPNTD